MGGLVSPAIFPVPECGTQYSTSLCIVILLQALVYVEVSVCWMFLAAGMNEVRCPLLMKCWTSIYLPVSIVNM